MFEKLSLLFKISRANGIARRYFIVNGFDGALTMLGLTSAYISEAAENKKELRQLEEAMVKDLVDSTYGQATRLLPFVIALINGLAPLIISLIIILPLWATSFALLIPLVPLETAIMMALAMLFLLGVFLGRISDTFWLWAGLRTLLIAAATAGLIFLLSPHR